MARSVGGLRGFPSLTRGFEYTCDLCKNAAFAFVGYALSSIREFLVQQNSFTILVFLHVRGFERLLSCKLVVMDHIFVCMMRAYFMLMGNWNIFRSCAHGHWQLSLFCGTRKFILDGLPFPPLRLGYATSPRRDQGRDIRINFTYR